LADNATDPKIKAAAANVSVNLPIRALLCGG
jgi:hypothetical protein